MKLQNHSDIIDAIVELHEVEVQFMSREDGGAILTRRCAPMDYAPSSRARDKTPRYHFWDFESDGPGNHTLSLLADQIVAVKVLDSTFDPADFVTWTTTWTVPRTTWGQHS
jgi:hypothetical protein